jgi:beta-lactamase class D
MKSSIFLITLILSVSILNAQDKFQKHFEKFDVTGSITIYDYNNDKWIISDKDDFKKMTTPASTFKIPNSLIAIETGVLKNENEVLKWDSVKRRIPSWNQDTDLKDAYRNSTVWFYQELARRIGLKNYEKYLSGCDYGNQQISKVDTFWLDEAIKINPENQINFLKALYEEKLPFSERTFRIVKKIMIEEKNENYTLSSKTGWGSENKNNLWVGWWVGYVETTDNVYFFATRIYKDKNKDSSTFPEARKIITRNILKEMGII